MAKSHFDILLIVISVTIVFVLPLLGWLIYALIKRHRENSLVLNANPRILAELSSSEAVSRFSYEEYLAYRKHLVRDFLIGVSSWNGIILVAYIYGCIREGYNVLTDNMSLLVIFFVIPNVFIIIASAIKFMIIGDGEDVLKIKCHILKESRRHTKDPEILVLFYDLDLCDFRKYRFHLRHFDAGFSDYILARHGYKKMRVICFYDQFMNIQGKHGN